MNSAAPVTPVAGTSATGSDTTTVFIVGGAEVGTDVTGAMVGSGVVTATVGVAVGLAVIGLLVLSNVWTTVAFFTGALVAVSVTAVTFDILVSIIVPTSVVSPTSPGARVSSASLVGSLMSSISGKST